MGNVRWQRQSGKERWKFKETYPSQYAKSTKYPSEGDVVGVPASELEPRAIKCAQCGLPIEDHALIAACPSCGSDNFLGRIY